MIGWVLEKSLFWDRCGRVDYFVRSFKMVIGFLIFVFRVFGWGFFFLVGVYVVKIC